MENLIKDIETNIPRFVGGIKSDIYQLAENQAEIYVSTILGLEDEDGTKQIIKNQYIDEFVCELIGKI